MGIDTTSLSFKYDEKNIRAISIQVLDMDSKRNYEIAYLIFRIADNVLYINQFQRNSFADNHFDSSYHFGTMLFNELLCYLQRRNEKFNKISGVLRYPDAENNWATSIPFYSDFPKYLNKDLGYSLSFHLLDNGEEIVLSKNNLKREKEINDLIDKHKNKTDMSFYYDII